MILSAVGISSLLDTTAVLISALVSNVATPPTVNFSPILTFSEAYKSPSTLSILVVPVSAAFLIVAVPVPTRVVASTVSVTVTFSLKVTGAVTVQSLAVVVVRSLIVAPFCTVRSLVVVVFPTVRFS